MPTHQVISQSAYRIQDPNFVPESERASVQERNNQIHNEYFQAAKATYEHLLNGGTSFYSNIFGACDENTIHSADSATPSFFHDLREKTVLHASIDGSSVDEIMQVYYLDNDNTADSGTNRTVKLGGKTYNVSGRWSEGYESSTSRLNSILNVNKGTSGWYDESYEGILVCRRIYIINLNSISSGYAQINPAHSDNLTSVDDLAIPMTHYSTGEYLISGSYGIGLEFRTPELSLNGVTINKDAGIICSTTNNSRLHIRGSIYDIS